MNLLHYLLEANLYLAAFYLLYVIFLRSETLYQLNRAYLLITSLAAFVIPFLQLSILKPVLKPIEQTGSVSVDMNVAQMAYIVPSKPTKVAYHYSFGDYLTIGYALITITLLLFLVFKISKLIALSKKGNAKRYDGFVLVEVPEENVAFSFFGYLFVNNKLSSSQTIMHHEEVHIRQRHSWDVLYFELIKAFNWFNPAVYLLQKTLKEVHEFIADREVANAENGAADYADFLINNAYGLSQSQLTNSFFNKNLLKRRIIMLYQKKSGRAARLKYLLTLPLAGGLLCASTLAFTTKTYGVLDLTPKHIATANNAPATPKTSSEPSYPGGNEALYKYLKANINHAKVKEVDIENHLFMMFVVEKDGSLSNIKAFYSPKGDLTPETNSEISRVLSTSPKWIPGTRNGYAASVKHFVLFNFDKSATFKTVDNSNVTVLQPEKQTGPVFTAVDSQPSFPGGVDGFNKFLAKNIKYPKGAKDKGVSGKVFIQFIIEADGTLSDIKVKRDPGAGLGAEAARVLKLSPKWKPGMQNGKKVRVMYTVPVNFALDDNDKKAAIPLKGGPNVGNMYAAAPTNEADDAAGNTNELYKYIRDHVRYVTDAKNRNIQGRVFTSFTVNSNKKIQDIIVVRSPDKLLSDEVVRVLSAYNLTDGKANANYVLPVNFAISAGDNKWESKKAENAQPIANPYKPGSAETVNLNEIVVVTYPAK